MKEQLKGDGAPRVAAKESERIHFFPAVKAPAENWPNVGQAANGKEPSETKSKPASGKEKPNRER